MKKAVLKRFPKFTGKYLLQSLFFNVLKGSYIHASRNLMQSSDKCPNEAGHGYH